MIPVTSQPFAINSPAVAAYEPLGDEKGYHHAHAHHQYAQQFDGEACAHRRCRCDNKARFRRIAVGVLLAVTSVLVFLVLLALYDIYFNAGAWMGSLGLAEDGTGSAWAAVGAFVKRQSEAATSSTTTNNTFVNNKLYLIVIFGGLVLVIFAAVCLSACCCRAAFENPLCCPCYLCACCGGLACLECIGCGLCAAGVEQL